MRVAIACTLVVTVSTAALSLVWAQSSSVPSSSPLMQFAQATKPAQPAASPTANCANPNGLGVARTVEIDTTGGPGFGFEHFKQYDFLREGEFVLTFDDGPWPGHTPAVLKALADYCTKAVFFPIGLHATYHPEILKQVAAAGHAVGSHTWSHQDLTKSKGRMAVGNGKFEIRDYDPKEEIEKGISAVQMMLGTQYQESAFFRFPALRHPPEMVKYLGERNVGIFSTDMDSFDFKMKKPEQVVASVMAKVKKHGKGIILMHDFQKATSLALPEILAQMKAGGYKIVAMKSKDPVKPLPEYDAMVVKEQKLPTMSSQPMESVVRTVE